MRADKLQNHWIDSFSFLIELCKIKSSEDVIVLTETASRQVNIDLISLVLKRQLIK